ncbi:hypothetical protein WG922_04600 [Ramlibacter sp. AN1015]|uniref:hypothetical protein n=1 Tax=Ramlibacter sp. AN1015 TaxID=3133428 RepID=UPI0030C1474E
MVTLAVLLGLAFYLVVSHQVRKAEARRTAAQVQQTAFSDCLQYVVGSTIGTCTSRLGLQQSGAEVRSAGPGASATADATAASPDAVRTASR